MGARRAVSASTMSRMEGIGRRGFLKLTAGAAVVAALPWGVGARCDVAPTGRAFAPHQRATFDAIAARIVPADVDAGAVEAGVGDYVERLLTAFDYDPPWVFAGGPFSGRTPFPDKLTGTASTRFPEDSFAQSLPLSRTAEIAWRTRIYGSAHVSGAGRASGTQGLRDAYIIGLAGVDARARELFGRAFVDLTADEQDRVLAEADETFVRQVVEHTVEAMYAAPEYGGNRNLVAWRAIGYEGDSQPLGYSIFDASRGSYVEIPPAPVSRPNPDEVAGFSAETLAFVSAIVAGAGGKRFF